jgi:hypothetical protein
MPGQSWASALAPSLLANLAGLTPTSLFLTGAVMGASLSKILRARSRSSNQPIAQHGFVEPERLVAGAVVQAVVRSGSSQPQETAIEE